MSSNTPVANTEVINKDNTNINTDTLTVDVPVLNSKKSPSINEGSADIVLSSPNSNSNFNRDDEIEKLKLEIMRLHKIINTKSESDSAPEPMSFEDKIKLNFRVLFEFKSKTLQTGRRMFYIFKFKNPKIYDFLFAREKEGCFQYDELCGSEKKVLDLYLKNSSDKKSKVIFSRDINWGKKDEDPDYTLNDFLIPFEDDVKVLFKKDVSDIPLEINSTGLRVVFVLLSTCCRRLFSISFGGKKRRLEIYLPFMEAINETYVKAIILEKEANSFYNLSLEDKITFMNGKGLLYSTLFYIPDDLVIKRCIIGLFEMLEVLNKVISK